MKKILLGLVAAVVLAAGGGAWWVYSERDTLIADAIRTYGPEMLGVSVKLGGVKTDLANETATLQNLVIGNPAGFKTPHAVSLGAVSLKLDVASLTKDVILIREISVVKPDITYEHKSGGSNLDVIQRNAEKFVADKTAALGMAKDDKAKDKAPAKKLIIEHVYVRDAKANVSAEILQGKAMSVPIATGMPRLRTASTGIRPLLRKKLLSGQCATTAPLAASVARTCQPPAGGPAAAQSTSGRLSTMAAPMPGFRARTRSSSSVTRRVSPASAASPSSVN
jgi:hypothetical protein